MGKGGSWLVERLNRCVQIPIERMGFGQRGGGLTCLGLSGVAQTYAGVRPCYQSDIIRCQKGTPCPSPRR